MASATSAPRTGPTPPGPPADTLPTRAMRLFGGRRDQLAQFDELFSAYGDIVFTGRGKSSFLLIRRPEHVEHVLIGGSGRYVKAAHYRLLATVTGQGLLTNEGDSWAAQRRLMQPMFAKRHLGDLGAHMVAAIDDHLAGWDDLPDGSTVEISEAMSALALDVVGRALFGTSLSGIAGRLRPAVLVGLDTAITAARLQSVFTIPPGLVDLIGQAVFRAPVLPPPLHRIRHAMRTIDDVVNEVIDARVAEGDNGRMAEDSRARTDDLLGLLLSARDDEDRPMDRRQVRDEIVTLMLAGHETTANGLAWMWHLLSRHHEARERMLDEVDAVVGRERRPDVDAVDALPWTKACFDEAMRLYPPAWVLEREAVVDDEIDGFRIPQGTTVFIPVFAIHRDPRWWPDPEAFDPARFLPDAKVTRGSYLPFGAGRRICIGAAFAQLEATLITAAVSSRFLLDGVRDHVDPEPTVTLRPRQGLPMTLRRR